MARMQREKSLADYVVIAISPALIMTLVGSLAFFLLEVTYRGQYRERLMWVLFCFVFGAVLVARIAVEVDRERANLFGLALAAATGFFAFRYVDAVFVAWILLAVIWWCAWKLVFDCTLIDDNEDSSGEGLLQAGGFDGEKNQQARSDGEQTDAAGVALDSQLEDPSNEAQRRPHAPGLWVVYFSLAALPLFGVGQLFIPMAEAGRRTYAFQLLALYVASALGLLLSTSFLGLRRYLRQRKLEMPAAMTGSWLGLGGSMALTVLVVALLIPRPQSEYALNHLIDKLDEKARQASNVAMLGGDRGEGEGRRIGAQDAKADQPGEGGNPPEKSDDTPKDAQNGAQKGGQQAGQKDGPNGGKNDEHADAPGGEKQKNGDSAESGGNDRSTKTESQGQADDEGKKPGGSKSGSEGKKPGSAEDKKEGSGDRRGKPPEQRPAERDPGAEQKPPDKDRDGKQDASKKNDGNGRVGEPPNGTDAPAAQVPPAPAVTSFLGPLAASVKWFIYAALTLAGIYLVIRNWASLVAILARMWNELVAFWNSLFGGKREEGVAGESTEAAAAARWRPFASYENPFHSGADRRMTPAQLALYTFDALEAWSRESLVPRTSEQTPLEFADALSELRPEISRDVKQTALLYARLVYAKKSPTQDGVEALARLWRRMGEQRMGGT